jgi:hypothetical protein
MNGARLKANLIFIFSTFGSFLGSRYVTKNYGSKVHAEYGEPAVATGIATGAIAGVKKIPNAEVGLGLIAGTGMNAVWSIASIPKIKEQLPKEIQVTLGDDSFRPIGSLDGFSDEELMGNERVINIARTMADVDKEAYVSALIAAAENKKGKTALPENTELVTVGAKTESLDYQSGLEGEQELEGNSLD